MRTLSVLFMILVFVFVQAAVCAENDGSDTQSTIVSATRISRRHKARNADLLSSKMYNESDDDEQDTFSASTTTRSNSDRVQMRGNRHRRRRGRRGRRRNQRRKLGQQLDSTSTETSAAASQYQAMSPSEKQKLQRSVFNSLKSSDVMNVGPVPPSQYLVRDRHCRTVPFNQIISETGCISQHITNNYCIGLCQSVFIPSNETNGLPYTSCPSCLPKRYEWISVKLECPLKMTPSIEAGDEDTNQIVSDAETGIPEPRRILGFRIRRIHRVIKCACQSEMF